VTLHDYMQFQYYVTEPFRITFYILYEWVWIFVLENGSQD